MRPWLKRSLATLAVAGMAVATLPWWLGAALPLIGRPLHLTFGGYRRIGYSRFAVNHTVYRHGPVQVTVSHAEADTPLLWLWRHSRGADRLITADGWAVAVDRSTTPSRPRRPPGMVSLHALLEILDTHLSSWLPRAEVTNGVVGWPTGGFRLARAEWTPGHLDVSGLRWRAGEAAGRVVFGDRGVIAVEALEPDRSLRASLRWSGAEAEGQAWVSEQMLRLSGHYAEQGWLPVHAEATAPSWTLPADKPRWQEFYSSITGHGSAVWDHGTFVIAVQAKWKPRAVLAPPASVDARVTGDRHQWSIESLHVESPVADLALSAPLRFGYGVLPRFEHARLKASFDFDHWRQGPLKGRASALLDASGAANQIPQVVFSLEGSDLSWGRWKVDSLRAAGTWRNSTLAFSRLEVKSPDGTAAGTGGYDFGTQTLAAARADFSLSQVVLARWLPPGISAQSASATVRAAGRWPALTHDGSCVITAGRVGILKPMDLKASWHGEGFNLSQFHAAIAAGASALVVDGSADRQGLQVKRALFTPSGSAPWTLQSPAQVAWSPALQISGVRFAAPGGTALALDLGGSRAIEANLSEISLGWMRDLVMWKGPDILVHSLRFSGAWEKDALVFSSQAAAELRLGVRSAQVSFSAEGDGRALEVQALRLEENGRSFASADGRLPLSWNRRGTIGPRFDPDGAIDFRAETDPTSPSWAALAAEFGLALEAPQAHLRVHGTLRHLLGDLEAGVARLGPATGGAAWKVPSVENLSVSLRADASGIVLDHLNATFAGQPLSASGRIPLQAAEWDELTRDPAALWKRAEARLDVPDADLAPLARTFPDLLSPRGRWRLHLDLARGQWNGAVHVENAALRPTAGLGLVQGITGDLLFHGRSVEIQSLVAEIGGQEVRVGGRAEFPAGGRPKYSLSLKGRDIPVVRQAGLVIRADLDLAANTTGRQTRVSGRVNVIDGILLGDLADLIPSGTAGGQRPPPYFSIEAAPFGGWLLGVDVAAEQTLRVRTTLFSGTASAQFHLGGTLADPRAIGQLRVTSGQVSLPFATFDIQFGSVRLTADDPFHPQLDVTATARTYDYDLRMEARGGADDPIITFSSNPPLPSDQVLLLVMTGQVPSVGGVAGTAPSQVAGLGAYLGQSLFSSVGSGGGDNRLAVISGQEISISGKPTYEVDYKLGSRWWLVGEYDVFDDYNAGVKWRVISKGGKP